MWRWVREGAVIGGAVATESSMLSFLEGIPAKVVLESPVRAGHHEELRSGGIIEANGKV
ncbi:hypothetical protein Syun_030218 [Stephania yunnanensis]|uniref:Uncharacterized protein n=1 Tax=Stephania yunnanensis TaxID=152371 RepID=A0AAP0HI11_9MAGN